MRRNRMNMRIFKDGHIDIKILVQVLDKYCKDKFDYRIKDSKSTSSVYVSIMTKDNKYRISFRMSDHPKSKNDKTSVTLKWFPLRKSTRFSTLENFIENRVKDIKIISASDSIKNSFAILQKKSNIKENI